MRLNVLPVASVAILLLLVFLDSSSALDRCGPGFHSNSYGRCTPNAGRVIVPPRGACRRNTRDTSCCSAGTLPSWIPLAATVKALRGAT
jgi:hypothetical protein